MHTLTHPHPQSPPVRLSLPVWLAVFLSPTAYVFLLMLLSRAQLPAPAGSLIISLFGLIPVVALLTCGTMIWRLPRSLKWRIGGLILTTLAMLLQCAVWFVIIVSAITVAISPAQ